MDSNLGSEGRIHRDAWNRIFHVSGGFFSWPDRRSVHRAFADWARRGTARDPLRATAGDWSGPVARCRQLSGSAGRRRSPGGCNGLKSVADRRPHRRRSGVRPRKRFEFSFIHDRRSGRDNRIFRCPGGRALGLRWVEQRWNARVGDRASGPDLATGADHRDALRDGGLSSRECCIFLRVEWSGGRLERARGCRYDAPRTGPAGRGGGERRGYDFDFRGAERLDPVGFASALRHGS